jgi:lysophospholipase L1-like esterase
MGVRASTERRPTFYFVGDSITEFGSDPNGSGFISLLQKEYVRCVDMINRGLAGYNTRWVAQHALPIFENEVATQFQANFVTVFLGANDAALPNGPNKNQYVPLDEYKTNLTTILTTLRPHLPPKAKFLLITPPAVIDSQRGGKDRSNEAAGEYARACIDVANAENVAVLDLHTYFNKTYPDEAERKTFFVDGLHFSSKGNEIVAKMIDVKIKAIFDKGEVDRFHQMQLPGWDHWVN